MSLYWYSDYKLQVISSCLNLGACETIEQYVYNMLVTTNNLSSNSAVKGKTTTVINLDLL